MTAVRRVLLALALLWGASLATTPALAAGTTTVTMTVSIAGDTTTPLTGSVTAWPAPFNQGGGFDFTGGSATRDLTDGVYIFSVSLDTMDGTTRYYKAGSPAGVVDRAQATQVTLDGTPFGFSLEFPQIGRLSGHVTNGAGGPMAGITVLRNRLGAVSQVVTDGTGAYDFGYVQTGRTFLSVPPSGGWAGDMVPVTIPTTGTVTADLVMAAPATVTGLVLDSVSGDPVPGIEIAANRRVGTDFYTLDSQMTDSAGHFSIGGLQAGDYALGYGDPLGGYPHVFSGGSLILATATLVTLSPGATTTFDQSLTQLPKDIDNRPLAGVVTDGVAPIAGIEVTALDPAGNPVGLDTTDRSGRWAIDVPDGSYRLRAREGFWLQSHPSGQPWFPEYYPEAWLASDATTTVVAGDFHPGLNLTLARAGVLTTTVTGPGGATAVDAGFRAYAADGTLVAEDPAQPFDGNQLTALLPPGTWKVLVTGQTSSGTVKSLLPQWYGGGTSLTSAPVVDVDPAVTIVGTPTSLPGRLAALTKPRILGTPQVGRRLTATRGAWNLMTGTTFSFTWLRGTRVVGSAASYTVKRADRGAVLKVRVRAANAGLSTTVTRKIRIPAAKRTFHAARASG